MSTSPEMPYHIVRPSSDRNGSLSAAGIGDTSTIAGGSNRASTELRAARDSLVAVWLSEKNSSSLSGDSHGPHSSPSVVLTLSKMSFSIGPQSLQCAHPLGGVGLTKQPPRTSASASLTNQWYRF